MTLSEYYNSTPIEKLIQDSEDEKLALGSFDNVQARSARAKQVFNFEWVRTIRDLRMLNDDPLETIKCLQFSELPQELLEWFIKECNKDFEDDTPNVRGFTYIRDFDKNGIVYYIATDCRTKAWSSPNVKICVHMSSNSVNSMPGYNILNNNPDPDEYVLCVTKIKKNSWILIDFTPQHIKATHYSLRHMHCSTHKVGALRSWRFEGSNNNGITWNILSQHNDDRSLNSFAKNSTKTWKLSDCKPINNSEALNKYYTHFRIYQTGINSNEEYALACSGFEIYGVICNNKYINKPYRNMNYFNMNLQLQPIGNNNLQLKPIKNRKTRTFIYNSDFDKNGLLYFIGICGGLRMRKCYSNPADIGAVRVTASSLAIDSKPLSVIVGRNITRCVTNSRRHSWIDINLKKIFIKLTQYTFRHYISWDTDALRRWNLEGSNDNGKTWMLINRHWDDISLQTAGSTHTWNIDTNKYFNRFRIIMTGRNSNAQWYLACSGIELYGIAYGGCVSQRYNYNIAVASISDQKVDISDAPNYNDVVIGPTGNNGTSFDYLSDFDTNGIIYFLGTEYYTKKWENPAKLATGYVSVKTSGLLRDSSPKYCLIGRTTLRCGASPIVNHKNSWIIIDFKDYAINPTYYTLRHYSSYNTEALRNWRLEGSLDGISWIILCEHFADESLQYCGQSFTWKLPIINRYYQMFRIFQYDYNSNNHYYLALSGFEIYGNLIKKNTSLNWDNWSTNKSYNLKINHLRNSVTNTGNDDKWQTVKTRQALDYNNINGINSFTILCEKCEITTNKWQFMIGIAPGNFICNGNTQWLGSQNSWAYIGGTGGKCFNSNKYIKYGKKWGHKPQKVGDVVTCISDRNKKTISFILNNKSQGCAFNNYEYKNKTLFAAVSMTGNGSRLRLMEKVTPNMYKNHNKLKK